MASNTVLNFQKVKAGKETSVNLLVKIQGSKGDQKRKPLPLNLSVVIDRSGSMSGAKLQYVKMAAQELVRSLNSKDRLSLVSYGHDVRVELEPQAVVNKSLFRRAIDQINIHGNTFLSGGWIQGCEFVSSALNDKGVNRVLLLTDGLANEGITDNNQLVRMAQQQRALGVTTTTFGVGMGYNEDLLARMANQGGGAFYFIDDPDQASVLFKEELKDLYNIAGQNLQIKLETESAVRSAKQLYTYPMQQHQGALVYQLGDIYAEEERYQLFELKLGELKKGEVKLGQVTISYDAFLGEKGDKGDKIKKVESVHEIVIEVLPAKGFKKGKPDPEVGKLVLLQKVRQAREKALQLADGGKFEEAMLVLQAMADAIKASGLKDEELLNEYDRLLEEAKDMEFGQQRYDSHSRKVQTYLSTSAPRSARYDSIKGELHLRHKLTQEAYLRAGPAPRRIEWRGGTLDLTSHKVTIGTDSDNDIVLSDPTVDLRHCRLEEDGGDWYLINKSPRGTIANAGVISCRFRLSVGDVIRVGETVFRLF